MPTPPLPGGVAIATIVSSNSFIIAGLSRFKVAHRCICGDIPLLQNG